jgi:hypothetical protein
MMNLLLDNLHDDLIVSDNSENPRQGAIGCYKYPKIAIERPDFFIR